MAENDEMPYMPRLEIVKVPPTYSSGVSLFSLRAGTAEKPAGTNQAREGGGVRAGCGKRLASAAHRGECGR